MPLPGGSDPNPVPVPLVFQARDHSSCHHSCKVVPNSENVMKLIGPLSLWLRAISSHLQTCGCSIVVGSNAEKINKVSDLKGVVSEINVLFQPVNWSVFGIGSTGSCSSGCCESNTSCTRESPNCSDRLEKRKSWICLKGFTAHFSYMLALQLESGSNILLLG